MYKKFFCTLTLAISFNSLAYAASLDCPSKMVCDEGVCSAWYQANDENAAQKICIQTVCPTIPGCTGNYCTIYHDHSGCWQCSCAER